MFIRQTNNTDRRESERSKGGGTERDFQNETCVTRTLPPAFDISGVFLVTQRRVPAGGKIASVHPDFDITSLDITRADCDRSL